MEDTAPPSRIGDVADARRWRRILVAIGLVVAVLLLVLVAIYAGAFILFAPMMQ